MKVLIISDTHGEMPIDIEKMDFDAVVHAGDIGDRSFFSRIDAAAGKRDLFAVSGNTDFFLADYLPENITSNLGSARFYLVHNLSAPHRIRESNESEISSKHPDIVFFGHTHTPDIEEKDGIIYLNPGSLGKRGLTGSRSFATADIQDSGEISAKIFDIDTKEILVSKKFNKINGLFMEI